MMNETAKEPIRLESFGRHEWRAYRGGDLVATFEHRFDADRFAASEDLLKACKAAVESSASLGGGQCRCGACNMARAAIAKAEGHNA